jgi:hypothetical protein
MKKTLRISDRELTSLRRREMTTYVLKRLKNAGCPMEEHLRTYDREFAYEDNTPIHVYTWESTESNLAQILRVQQ